MTSITLQVCSSESFTLRPLKMDTSTSIIGDASDALAAQSQSHWSSEPMECDIQRRKNDEQ